MSADSRNPPSTRGSRVDREEDLEADPEEGSEEGTQSVIQESLAQMLRCLLHDCNRRDALTYLARVTQWQQHMYQELNATPPFTAVASDLQHPLLSAPPVEQQTQELREAQEAREPPDMYESSEVQDTQEQTQATDEDDVTEEVQQNASRSRRTAKTTRLQSLKRKRSLPRRNNEAGSRRPDTVPSNTSQESEGEADDDLHEPQSDKDRSPSLSDVAHHKRRIKTTFQLVRRRKNFTDLKGAFQTRMGKYHTTHVWDAIITSFCTDLVKPYGRRESDMSEEEVTIIAGYIFNCCLGKDGLAQLMRFARAYAPDNGNDPGDQGRAAQLASDDKAPRVWNDFFSAYSKSSSQISKDLTLKHIRTCQTDIRLIKSYNNIIKAIENDDDALVAYMAKFQTSVGRGTNTFALRFLTERLGHKRKRTEDEIKEEVRVRGGPVDENELILDTARLTSLLERGRGINALVEELDPAFLLLIPPKSCNWLKRFGVFKLRRVCKRLKQIDLVPVIIEVINTHFWRPLEAHASSLHVDIDTLAAGGTDPFFQTLQAAVNDTSSVEPEPNFGSRFEEIEDAPPTKKARTKSSQRAHKKRKTRVA